MALIHPNMRTDFRSYEEYRFAMDDWKNTHNAEKWNAQAHYNAKIKKEMQEYNEFLKKEKGEKMTTFNIKKRDNAPDFVIGSFGCKLGDLEPYVNSKGYINFDILKGKESGMYVKINEYGLDKEESASVTKIAEMTQEEIPF